MNNIKVRLAKLEQQRQQRTGSAKGIIFVWRVNEGMSGSGQRNEQDNRIKHGNAVYERLDDESLEHFKKRVESIIRAELEGVPCDNPGGYHVVKLTLYEEPN